MEIVFVDKILPFLRKKQTIEALERLNLFQFYLQRFGLGEMLTTKIIKWGGVHSSFKVKNYIPSLINQEIKLIFMKSASSLDLLLEQEMTIKLKNDLNLYSYRGDRYRLKLPLHGQRRRANGKTVKRVRQLTI